MKMINDDSLGCVLESVFCDLKLNGNITDYYKQVFPHYKNNPFLRLETNLPIDTNLSKEYEFFYAGIRELLLQSLGHLITLEKQKTAPVFGSRTQNTLSSNSDLNKLKKIYEKIKQYPKIIFIFNRLEAHFLSQFTRMQRYVYLQISLPPNKRGKILEYLKKYFEQYTLKHLEGQSAFYKPDFYIKKLESLINSKDYKNKHGDTNLSLPSNTTPLFCHTIYLMHINKQVKIKKFKLNFDNQKISWEVDFDNLMTSKANTATQQKQQTNDVKKYGKLTINSKTKTMQFGTGDSIGFNEGNNEIKLLLYLLSEQRVFSQFEIAKKLEIGKYLDDSEKDISLETKEAIKAPMNKLRNFLKTLGMTNPETKQFIDSRSGGYIVDY